MKRKIVIIDEDKCSGCGKCAEACHEGAIEMIDGKAVLVREDYCDGLGACLPVCPEGAITIEERDDGRDCGCGEHDHHGHRHGHGEHGHHHDHGHKHHDHGHDHAHGEGGTLACGCPGSSVRTIERGSEDECHHEGHGHGHKHHDHAGDGMPGRLSQWPVQIKLVPANAKFLDGAKLLVAADCAAFACGSFHERFIKGRITLIGCPKLDDCDYSDKLAEIIRTHDIKNITVARMEVPCCGLDAVVRSALEKSGKMIPWRVAVISADGSVNEE